MNPRTTGILFVVAALLGAFIYLYELRDDSDEEGSADSEKRMFPGLEAADVDWIALSTRDGQSARLKRDGGHWSLAEPIEFAADDVTAEGLASSLVQLEFEAEVPGDPEFEAFGVAAGAREVTFEAAGTQHTLRLGHSTPVGSNTYALLVDAGRLVYLQTWRANALGKTLDDLRDRRVLEFDRAAVSGASIRWPDGRVDLERRDGVWWLVAPLEERADQATVDTLLSDLAFLQADGFIDDRPDDAALGLAEPQLHVLLSGARNDGVPFNVGFAIGAERDGALVARGRDGGLYTLALGRLDDFDRSLFAYRFKQLARFEVADARRFEIVFASEDASDGEPVRGELVDGAWRSEPLAMDPRKIGAMVAELARLDASSIVADALGDAELAALGLLPPRATVRVFGASNALFAEVAFGAAQEGRGILARRPDSSVVYRVESVQAELIPQSRASLLADFVPGAEAEAELDFESGDDALDADMQDGVPGI